MTSPRLSPSNFDVPAGTTLRWRFDDELKHDITVADAPFGFSSQPLSGEALRTGARSRGPARTSSSARCTRSR